MNRSIDIKKLATVIKEYNEIAKKCGLTLQETAAVLSVLSYKPIVINVKQASRSIKKIIQKLKVMEHKRGV